MKCSNCKMDLDGLIYYQINKIKLCHFCYEGLERKGDDDE